ncbi:MAG: murein biosynthesis integral membrane protein MurJ, partial [Proteobacteria bacterium]|nr:murein biosynthesis integral membrane protein MurJ [Pseudomonadota bacterium]
MKKLFKSGALVACMTGLSRMTGLARDVLFAAQFGASVLSDAFLIAFKIPNFFRRLTAEGVFNHVFVPVLARIQTHGTRENLLRFVASGYGIFGLIQLALALVIGLAAPVVIAVFAPGTLDNPEQYQLTVRLLHWTAPYLFFISLASMCAALLNFHNRFALPAVAPILLNLSLITAIVYGASWHESHITAVAVSVSVAGVLQLLILLPPIIALGYFVAPTVRKIHSGVTDVLKLMLPVIAGTAIVQISLLLDTLVASLLQTGSITWLYYSDRLIELPLGIFAVALATVITPALSRIAAQKHDNADPGAHHERYRQTFRWALRLCLVLALPSAIGLAVIAPLVVNTLFEYGQFSAFDSRMTTLSIYAYAAGLPAFMLIKPLVAAFYSHEDTRTPLRIAATAIMLTLTGHCVVLILHLQTTLTTLHVGLALSTSAGAWLNATMLALAVRRRGWLTAIDNHPTAPATNTLTTTPRAEGESIETAEKSLKAAAQRKSGLAGTSESPRRADELSGVKASESKQKDNGSSSVAQGSSVAADGGAVVMDGDSVAEGDSGTAKKGSVMMEGDSAAERDSAAALGGPVAVLGNLAATQRSPMAEAARIIAALTMMVAVLLLLIALAPPWRELPLWQKVPALIGMVALASGTYFAVLLF